MINQKDKDFVEYTMEIAEECLIDNMIDVEERAYLLEDEHPIVSTWDGLIENWAEHADEEIIELFDEYVGELFERTRWGSDVYQEELDGELRDYAVTLYQTSKDDLVAKADAEIAAYEARTK